jgi:hypothetical protein
MSQPKRYSIRGFSAALVEEDNGVMVKYSDYELLRQEFSLLAEERYTTIRALELENERLTKERNHYRWASINDGIACNERARENQDLENQIDALKAEVDSIRHTAFSIGLLQDKLRQKCEDYHHAMISNQNNVMLLKKSMSENERLRKAGDALARAAEQSAYHKEDYNVIEAWNAAKETQP